MRSEETAESLEEKLKMAEGEAHLLAKKATEAQQEIIWVKQEVLKVRVWGWGVQKPNPTKESPF